MCGYACHGVTCVLSVLLYTQMSWHPHSDHHLLLLTSDSRLRMYNVRNVSAPEMTVHLRCTGAGSSGERAHTHTHTVLSSLRILLALAYTAPPLRV